LSTVDKWNTDVEHSEWTGMFSEKKSDGEEISKERMGVEAGLSDHGGRGLFDRDRRNRTKKKRNQGHQKPRNLKGVLSQPDLPGQSFWEKK